MVPKPPQPLSDGEYARLKADHTQAAVARRVAESPDQSFLRDFVYGSIDGCVTTFAIASGAVGAGLSHGVVIILGLANVLADGFSMAVSNYLGTKADRQLRERARSIEEYHVDSIPDGETEEVREIFRQKGFEGELLERVVAVITSNRKLWIETMLKEEWGMSLAEVSPAKAALVTFGAFLAVGMIPLAPFVAYDMLSIGTGNPFHVSLVLTGLAFFGIGALKSRYVAEHWFRAGLETLLIGGGAAALAYSVGILLKGLQ